MAPMEPMVKNKANGGLMHKKMDYQFRNICRNFALSISPGFIYMILNKDISGYKYIKDPLKDYYQYDLSNFYLSLLRFIIRKLKLKFKKYRTNGAK